MSHASLYQSRYALSTVYGTSSPIIDTAALSAVHSFTQGNPRLIDNLMTDALTIGSQQNRKVIDAETIRAAVDTRGFTDEVFKVQFTKAVTIVMALFQKQDSCLSNKATTMCRYPADNLRPPTGPRNRGNRNAENKVLFVPPAMCRLTSNHLERNESA